jgi:hypothetical protein
MTNIRTDAQIEVYKIYTELLKPKMDKHKILQENLCLECFNIDRPIKEAELDDYGTDGYKCDKCEQTKEVFNEFIYFSIKELGFSIRDDLYGNIPRIYEKLN